MDNITGTLISSLLDHLDIPWKTGGCHEKEFHQIIKRNNLNLHDPKIDETTIKLLLNREFEYAYIQVLLNSVIPDGTASEFMKDSVKFRTTEDHYGNVKYDLKVCDKTALLKKKDPLWVYQNHKDIENFMIDSWEPYLKVKQIINNINSL